MLLVPSHTTSGPAVHITYPPASLFKFPPANLPATLAPPLSDFTFTRPFNIHPDVYNNLLSVNYPITIALVYAATVFLINQRNHERGHKPWAISKTGAFFAFVVAHNVFLAIFSAWTFAGMIHTIRQSWPGWTGQDGLAGAMDALCKISGPRGLGNAATYNSSTSSWGVTNAAIKLTGVLPDNTDVGRIWNEGLAYYGWLFYISKFYEVLDTMIILAKGKKSSFLQTYHHAGAMMCMWAGMRYMSPPIWMFVLVNSGIHALMYTYYTLTAFGVRVPIAAKRTLTTLQIAQFVVGASYAFAHLFIAYAIPVSTPYLFTHNISTVIPEITSSISSAVASATASAGVGNWLKKIALRAAGNEGLAENVHNEQGQTFGLDAIRAEEVEKARDEIRYKMEYPTVHCMDTSGEVFAILLNVMYLAPLTFLFVNFFIRSYSKRTSASTAHPSHAHTIEKAAHDALHGVEREIHEAMSNDLEDMSPEMRAKLIKATKSSKQALTDLKNNAGPKMEQAKKSVKEGTNKAGKKAQEGYEAAKPKVQEAAEKAGEMVQQAKENAAPKVKEVVDAVKAKASEVANYSKDGAKKAGDKAKDSGDKVDKKMNDGAEKAQRKAPKLGDKAKEGVDKAKEDTKEGTEKAKESTKEGADQAAKKTNEGVEKAEAKEEQAKNNAETIGEDTVEETSKSSLLDGDPSAYEVDFDEAESKEEKEAEAEMQPGGS